MAAKKKPVRRGAAKKAVAKVAAPVMGWNAMAETAKSADARLKVTQKAHEKASVAAEKAEAKAKAAKARLSSAKSASARRNARAAARATTAQLRTARGAEREARSAAKAASAWMQAVLALNARTEKGYTKALASAQKAHARKTAPKKSRGRRRARKAA